jgi:hypothetical protein
MPSPQYLGQNLGCFFANNDIASRAFRKSMTSRLARLAAANQYNHGGLVVREGQNNLVRIYEMLY